MGKEVERKFLVSDDGWREGGSEHYCQGYPSTDKQRTVRVRVACNSAFHTIKGIRCNVTRSEYEYEIPIGDAQEMLDILCLRPLIEKHRYRVEHGGMTREVDEFLGDNAGLVVAEIELKEPDHSFVRPSWLGGEITGDPRFYNANLVANPFSRWSGRPARQR